MSVNGRSDYNSINCGCAHAERSHSHIKEPSVSVTHVWVEYGNAKLIQHTLKVKHRTLDHSRVEQPSSRSDHSSFENGQLLSNSLTCVNEKWISEGSGTAQLCWSGFIAGDRSGLAGYSRVVSTLPAHFSPSKLSVSTFSQHFTL